MKSECGDCDSNVRRVDVAASSVCSSGEEESGGDLIVVDVDDKARDTATLVNSEAPFLAHAPLLNTMRVQKARMSMSCSTRLFGTTDKINYFLVASLMPRPRV